ERRRMQNAADAGALAGARELCFGEPSNAEAAALSYATDRNGAEWAVVDVIDNLTVSVEAGETMDTFFAGLIGIQTAEVRAEAAAICGKVIRVCQVWPMAFDASNFDKQICDQHLILWEDGKADCETYSCTCSPELGGAIPASDGRTWIDFSAVMADGQDDPCDQTGCGNAELGSRVEGETNKGELCRSYIELPSCAAGDSGVKSSSWAAAASQTDTIRIIPLYDPEQSPCVMEDDPGNACGHERYMLVDTGCVRVVGACRLCKMGETPPCPSGPRVIDVTIACDQEECNKPCSSAGSEPPGPGDPRAVSLVR
ncbi:MAG: hypothetical protein PVH41_12485, partial [Anaerolineae bacterium]